MREKRRQKRYPFDIRLRIESLYKQDNIEIIKDIEDIELTDISKSGIGFKSVDELPLGFYFNARITFNEKRYFYCVIKIIRRGKKETEFQYGCEFVGLADVLSNMVDDYGTEIK